MNIGIIGTGVVGRTLAEKLYGLGHDVAIGTRNAAETLARTTKDMYGNPPFHVWKEQHQGIRLLPFPGAARHGELVVNATSGAGSLEALRQAGEQNLAGKILLDISNPLDFSKGFPPSLFVCNTDSLGEQIQRAFPAAKVVKTLNTVTARVMVNPAQVANGDHHLFLSGNDPDAKTKTRELLQEWFGWKNVVDLGDITTARAAEMILPVWVMLFSVLKTPMFNFKIVT